MICERCTAHGVLQGVCLACSHEQGFRPAPRPRKLQGRQRPDGIIEFDGVKEPPRRWLGSSEAGEAANRWLRERGER